MSRTNRRHEARKHRQALRSHDVPEAVSKANPAAYLQYVIFGHKERRPMAEFIALMARPPQESKRTRRARGKIDSRKHDAAVKLKQQSDKSLRRKTTKMARAQRTMAKWRKTFMRKKEG